MRTTVEEREVTSSATAAALLLLLDGLDRRDGKKLARRLAERVIADEGHDDPTVFDAPLKAPSGSKP